ncbi:MAG: methyltransferase domain-containing protein [Bacteroidetes bacterium]|nr:methyltransferase domain-containing protein [Bacteroidota bacterium]MBU1372995.1 methyltransferase domain-containing protein [Bacteroidota bacterium]MBU1485438.1 methyltransferase domain-containing protein [Bacteroidota bacterium]MBU1759738.1 methyltransferase domain-containing protein [Bacteroidota bacterium]MBU2045375.1 methyltransferase domain-containing protein [Bacteroidota bacterium]
MEMLHADYWNSRYINQETRWDLGAISPPIKSYIHQLENKELRILIPGAGNAYEAIYLLENGFKNVTVVDFAEKALSNLKEKLVKIDTSNYNLIQDDFFNHEGEYDLILEQTFFCAINPELRIAYVKHTHRLLTEKGKIVGLLFNKEFPFEGPPFGGSEDEYRELFEPKFEIKIMHEAHNSIAPRKGSELFVILSKK